MTIIEEKRKKLNELNSKIRRITKTPRHEIRAMNDISKKMLLQTLEGLQAEKLTLLDEIINLDKSQKVAV